jgi:undecaprenyl diphosphate synthase
VAVDYSSRESIMRAAAIAPAEGLSREGFAKLLATVDHDPFPVRDVDLLIRTGGEQRLSDFLLWECAYAEFFFTSRMWPDFSEPEFAQALHEFASRERRFGKVLSA